MMSKQRKKEKKLKRIKGFKDLTPPFHLVDMATCFRCKQEINPTEHSALYGELENKDKRIVSYIVFHQRCWDESAKNSAPIYMFTNLIT